MPEYDTTRTFNLDVGLIFIVDKKNVDKVVRLLKSNKAVPSVGEKLIVKGVVDSYPFLTTKMMVIKEISLNKKP